jgi:hypothetical protein
VVVTEIFVAVAHVNVYLVSVVARAVDPVVLQREVPLALLRCNFARGNIVPTLAVFFSQRVKVTVDEAGMIPDALGTPLSVSNALIMYSPVARFFRLTEVTATVAASGPAVFIWLTLPLEASLCRW